MLEYKVTVDTSMKGANSPEAIEKTINEHIAQGWRFTQITSFATTNVSKVYCVFEREKA